MRESGVVHLFPVTALEPAIAAERLRALEAILFASAGPVAEEDLARRLPEGADCAALLAELGKVYADRGVNLVRVAGKWCFRTAPDLAHLMAEEVTQQRRLSRAALETLAIIAYHQPVTRAEIEDIRGVSIGKGTLDLLIEVGWVRLRGRRQAPGKPVTYGTSEAFLAHFGLDQVTDLPGLDELIGAGLLDKTVLPSAAGELPLDDPDGDGDAPDLDPALEPADMEPDGDG